MKRTTFLGGALVVAPFVMGNSACAQNTTPKSAVKPTGASTRLSPQASTQTGGLYRWRMVNEAAGGNTTGFLVHPLNGDVRYVQSGDTGGYRWDAKEQRWIQFADWTPSRETSYLTAMALDPKDVEVLYYAAGQPKGDIYKSTNGGRTFTAAKLKRADGQPVIINGLEDSSTLGPRLIVDPNNSQVVYYAARFDGLFRSQKGSAESSWSQVESLTARGNITEIKDGKEVRREKGIDGLAWVAADPGGGTVQIDGVAVSKFLYVGMIGNRQTAEGEKAEGGVWRSPDGGKSWERVPGPTSTTRSSMASDGTLYFSGGTGVWKIARGAKEAVDMKAPVLKNSRYQAISVDPKDPKHVVIMRYGLASREYSYSDANRLFRSNDGGSTWTELKAKWNSAAAWWNWFGAWAHWLYFDPTKKNVVWMGDWANPWRCEDISAPVTEWTEINRGKGGSYVCGIATPPAKKGQVVPPVYNVGADWAGFRLISVTEPPRVHLTQSQEGRYNGIADGTGVAFCETDPQFIAVVGGWDHGYNGGGGASRDGGKTWEAFEGKGLSWPGFKDSPKLGRIAVGSTLQENGVPILVWIPRFNVPRYSLDWGKTWTQSKGAPSGMTPSEWDPWQTLAADPIDGKTFYALSNNLEKDGAASVYKSTDGGANWTRAGQIKGTWNQRLWTEHHLKTMPGKSGVLWMSLRDPYTKISDEPAQGLFFSQDGGKNWLGVDNFDVAHSFAFGAPAPGKTNPAMYVAGQMGSKTGIFRSDDATEKLDNIAGATWIQIWDHAIDTDAQAVLRGLSMIGADRQQYGRVYTGSVGTGRSMYYGDPQSEYSKAPAAPRNLEATPGYNQIRLIWTDPQGAEKYTLYRATNATDAGTAIAQNLKNGGFLDTAFKAGETYFYRVEAANTKGKSAKSAAVKMAPFVKVEVQARFGSAGNNKDSFDKASDGDLSTAFDASAGNGGFTGIDSGKENTVTRIRYQPRDWNGKRMIGGKFQGAASQDGPWADLAEVKTEAPTGQWSEISIAKPQAFRYYRYLGPNEGHSNIKEMEFYSGGVQ